MAKRSIAGDLKGATRLAVTGTRNVTAVVQSMQRVIGGGPKLPGIGRPLEWPIRIVTAPTYALIHGIAELSGAALEGLFGALAPMLGELQPGPDYDGFIAALNGVIGDQLAETQNPLALPFTLGTRGHPLLLDGQPPPPDWAAATAGGAAPSPHLLIAIHGSCATDWHWLWKGHNHIDALATQLGATPIYARYNSGLHISENGAAFAHLLETAVKSWPVPVTAITVVAHSMGGLVTRSALTQAEGLGLTFRPLVKALAMLGTPHHGAPLERAGSWLHMLLGVTPYTAPLARLPNLRSAGITDLRHGSLLETDWHRLNRFDHKAPKPAVVPLPEGVRCYAVAASMTAAATGAAAIDGMVPVASALGESNDPARTLTFPPGHTLTVTRANHLDLLSDPRVAAQLLTWLG
jgi:hypothetical protein